MNIHILIILLLVVIAFMLICSIIWISSDESIIIGGGSSRSEDRVRQIFEELYGDKFPTEHPEWLSGLELDGYNEKYGVGFEFQGPQHTKFSSKYDLSYRDYVQRVVDDKYKVAMAEDIGRCLVTIDYILPARDLHRYIRSRLYDYARRHPKWVQKRKWPEELTHRPSGYMISVRHKAFTRYGEI